MDADRRERLRAMLKAAGTNATKASLAIGRSKDYLRDFLKGRKTDMSAEEWQALERLLAISVPADPKPRSSAAPSIPVELVQMALELVLRRLAGMSHSGAQELAALILEELQAPEPLGAGFDIAERRGALDYIIRRSGPKSDA
jgi:hypothetical protein